MKMVRLLSATFITFIIVCVQFYQTSYAKADLQYLCPPSSCGNIANISYPFRLITDPPNCGDISLIRIQSGNHLEVYEPSRTITFLNCENVAKSPLYIPTSSCNVSDFSGSKGHSYVMLGKINDYELENSCRIEQMARMPWLQATEDENISYIDIHHQLAYGFELSWMSVYAKDHQNPLACYADEYNMIQCPFYNTDFWTMIVYEIQGFLVKFQYTVLLWTTGKIILGIPCVIAFLIYKWRKRHLSMYNIIEEFLQANTNLMPIRYSYSEIKIMTKRFKHKLGEGGYGSVYKGKLRSGRLVAVKMLGKSKANGQEFINEVATIGRIHHVNVVQLVGFCVERSKRALVYEFMPKGSLDKHIFSQEGINSLDCKKMCEISFGVACGIEYLHQGCNMQILHFDIKPHNILLDENFIPKVSDFGLAQLYPLDKSIVSLTAARGTMGYIAPELFYKNIGGISYKADVYSYGMLLMEMASRRKNLNAVAEHTSQIYFPSWIYDQLNKGKGLEIVDATEEESRLRKKMIIVALWCIQMKPSDRPSMNKVREMLEAEVESLQIPPKPFLCPQEKPLKDAGEKSNWQCLSTPSKTEDSKSKL
ncbi:rust resistance kinase Lr10-like isoform X3 [Ziziphus jujuba]|uniref:Rust resistance kinase Lr10-like isoform X3 n=1 Tax=Ziziphus jujuba TaxID=326968 RepID=A0ABM4AFT4_ZIZJJ|nr:rust resistance kinase Lr10-like isoform X3 [Ziziphus jujuba]